MRQIHTGMQKERGGKGERQMRWNKEEESGRMECKRGENRRGEIREERGERREDSRDKDCRQEGNREVRGQITREEKG